MFKLQFTTTPTNINNTNNVVRVASRAKQLQQQLEQQLASNTTSTPNASSSLSSYNNTINSHNRSSNQYSVNNNNVNENNSSSTITPNTMNSINNCFPKSYTEYYQQQMHQQNNHHHQLQHAPYTVERTNGAAAAVAAHPSNPNNPFLATNFKKFHTNTNSLTCSMNRKNIKSEDKKFYSLKFSAKKNGGAGMLLKQSMGKCKRHHSFADGEQMPPNDTKAMKMHFYEPPVYENLTDSIQILECNVEQPQQPAAGPHTNHAPGHLKKKHGNHRHNRQRIFEDSNIILEPEKLSIYRSDSGISNSSFECITTPVPAPRQGELQPQPQVQHMKAHSNPVYMNISSGGSSTSSPSNHVQHTTATSLESPNDPSNDPVTSSCNSACNKHYKCKANNNCNSKEIIVHQQLPAGSSGAASTGNSSATSNNRKCKRRAPSSCSTLVNVEVC